MTHDKRTLDELLARASVADRYADYDIKAARTRLEQRQAARLNRHSGMDDGPLPPMGTVPPSWTEPAPDGALDQDHAWWDLRAVSWVVLYADDAERHLSDFIHTSTPTRPAPASSPAYSTWPATTAPASGGSSPPALETTLPSTASSWTMPAAVSTRTPATGDASSYAATSIQTNAGATAPPPRRSPKTCRATSPP